MLLLRHLRIAGSANTLAATWQWDFSCCFSVRAKLPIIGRQIQARVLSGFAMRSIEHVAIRIVQNVKQNAYRCFPSRGNSRCCYT